MRIALAIVDQSALPIRFLEDAIDDLWAQALARGLVVSWLGRQGLHAVTQVERSADGSAS
jgi:hypothetical protein